MLKKALILIFAGNRLQLYKLLARWMLKKWWMEIKMGVYKNIISSGAVAIEQ